MTEASGVVTSREDKEPERRLPVMNMTGSGKVDRD